MEAKKMWRPAIAVVRNLGWPLVIGLGLFTLITLGLNRGWISHPILVRYLTAHPVSYIATAMFCVGISSLGFKARDVVRQFGWLNWSLPVEPELVRSTDDAQGLIGAIEESTSESARQSSYLMRRTQAALEYVRRRGDGTGIDEELKYLADSDANEQHESYSLVRILIWATPMLGFLGTVIGISEALGNLSVGDGEGFDTMLQGLRSSLYVAFDTTAQALCMSIVLMFMQFLVDRFEKHLLTLVESRVSSELLPRFRGDHWSTDPVARSIERSSRALLESVETLVERQADLWSDAFQRAQSSWENSVVATHEYVGAALESAVVQAFEHAHQEFTNHLEQADQRWQRRWEQLHLAMVENAKRMQDQQKELIRHGEIMERVVKATGDVVQIETALERNFERVASSGQFEEALHNLSAAIHLLNAKLTSGPSPRTDRSGDSREKAA
ncbi:MAG: MotA/TolQ/ExbB proton channel family protein [Pirellulaceae bacterium]